MRCCIVAAALLLALLLCEAALRLFLPKYRDVAEGRALRPDELRIYAPIPNTRDWRVNPATKRRHPFHMNNLGLRQHRNFSDADILSATTVGVFGDSFVRGGYLDAPYVFTEPLDYLLNLDGDFTVLNFGVGGYGPAQSYFAYKSFDAKDHLDYVLFACYGDDLEQHARQGLFDLDDDGRLRQREVRGSAWWVPFVSKLHLTYLALDATGRLVPYVSSTLAELRANRGVGGRTRGASPDDLFDHGLKVFGLLVRRWRDEVEESGGRFLVVLLPTQPDYPRVRPLLDEAGVGAIDLNACYASRDEGHRERDWQESPYRLRNDGHWNELGNRLAAACLDERLRREAGLPAMADAVREASLAEYYAAFESPQLGSARGHPSHEESPQRGPLASERRARGHPSHVESPQRGPLAGEGPARENPEEIPRLASIQRKYQALGRFEVVDTRLASYLVPDNLALDSNHYDVYMTDSRLVFAQDDCHADDTERLFAHATPVDGSVLSPDTSHVTVGRLGMPLHDDAECIARYYMPRIPVSHILVGQRDSANAILWSGEIVLDRAAFEKTLAAMLAAAGEPVIASGMDVHVHGRRVFYVSDDCEGTDGRTSFFLHVVPMREADLPPERVEHGYDNLDFHQAGVTFGERCVVRWQLPDYPIRRIRTGQYVAVRDGEKLRLRNLWEGEADIGG